MGRKEECALRVVAQCRGEGVGYIALCSASPFGDLRAKAKTSQGRTVPCTLLAVDLASQRQALAPDGGGAWIVVVPLLACSLTVTVASGGGQELRHVFAPRASKLASRLLTFTSPGVASLLRGYELDHGAGMATLRLREVWPAGDGMVSWRMQAEFPGDGACGNPVVSVFDSRAHKVDASIICMERHVVPSGRDASESVLVATFSCLLPEALGNFYAVASLEGADGLQAFLGMNAPRAQGMIADTRRMTAGAEADGGYERWFSARRATGAELAQQHTACLESAKDLPLISIVMPAAAPDREVLEEAICSVKAQSYSCWELIVVTTGEGCPWAAEILDGMHDERMRLLDESGHIAAQGANTGIEAAQGGYVALMGEDDVLEPDALWHFAQEIMRGENVDLLYCDEDCLQDGQLCSPAFKPSPNYGKLYSCNYIGHLLMVSRHVLEQTERAAKNVAEAIDYDLALKAFETSRNSMHIPKVLYHVRKHGKPSSDSAATNRAHEAGRAALGEHLARRRIEASVEDGPLPNTYRVRYDLPEPQPLVSIVIPTRDHAELLETCVRSILDKSTYSNLEVVLVENNSTEKRTFDLYDTLRKLDERVRMITWSPRGSGDFNYSSVINCGVRESKGDYLILLNNDTEVIEAGWIEELMGCLMRPEVGVVGAKLLFADGLVQHVGMIAHPNGALGHVCQNLHADALGPYCAAALPGDYSMVTGACQMVRRSVFDELGGYDEAFAVGYNDGDFCLRARDAGYCVAVAPHARLYHREFATRGREVADTRLMARHIRERGLFCERHADFLAHGDPCINPNSDPYSLYGELKW